MSVCLEEVYQQAERCCVLEAGGNLLGSQRTKVSHIYAYHTIESMTVRVETYTSLFGGKKNGLKILARKI